MTNVEIKYDTNTLHMGGMGELAEEMKSRSRRVREKELKKLLQPAIKFPCMPSGDLAPYVTHVSKHRATILTQFLLILIFFMKTLETDGRVSTGIIKTLKLT